MENSVRLPCDPDPADIPEVRGEDDKGFREIDPIAAAGGEDTIVQDLQKLVEDARMGLFDLVEEDDAERLLPDGIGQSPPTSYPMYPGGAPMRRWSECSAENSDMSKRMYALSSPNRRLVRVLASSVLPTPVGPARASST